jgi:hypothetical protein
MNPICDAPGTDLWPIFWSVVAICITVYVLRAPWRDK